MSTSVAAVPKKLVDRLGLIHQQVKALQQEAADLRQKLLEAVGPAGEAEGVHFRVTVKTFEVRRIDYNGLLDELNPPSRLVKKYTTVAEQTRVDVSPK
ncbi:MAG: hypothetical protein QXT45_04765 [Candidatus Bilamarchaeaceae archaeon]